MFGVIISLVVFISVGSAAYFYYQLDLLKKNSHQQEEAQVAALVKKVAQLIVLPDNEKPTIMTVADKEKLKDQPFFNQATVGDKVLVYASTKKAILYNPRDNKIVEVASINLGQNTPQAKTPPIEQKTQ
ncbi:MAG: hypothetical protein AAB870_00075 [Patescibacteria group bacterium]